MDETRYNRYRGLILILVLAMIGINPRLDRTHIVVTSASGGTLGQQVEHDVLQSAEVLASSETLYDWQSSGFTPSDVFKNAFALENNVARSALCGALAELQQEQLSAFEQALGSHEATLDLSCAAQELSTIRDYWIAQTAAMDASRYNPGNSAESSDENLKTVASGEVPLEAASVHELSVRLLKKGQFALVFEGTVDPLVTRQILETLQSREARATFLIPGKSARKNGALVREMAREGNPIGSQGMEWRDYTLLDWSDADQEITDGAQEISAASERSSRLFAFPEESSSDDLDQLAISKGLLLVHGDLDSKDWQTFNAQKLVQYVQNLIQTHDRGVLVLHSRYHQTALALPAILDAIEQARGQVVTFKVR